MRNKLTYEEIDNGFVVTGSLRQPTIVEAINFLVEKSCNFEGSFVIGVQITGEYIPPEDVRSIRLYEFSSEFCPVCGKPHDLFSEKCPICYKRWE